VRFQIGTALIRYGSWSKVTLCWLTGSLTWRQPIKTRPEFRANDAYEGLISDPKVLTWIKSHLLILKDRMSMCISACLRCQWQSSPQPSENPRIFLLSTSGIKQKHLCKLLAKRLCRILVYWLLPTETHSLIFHFTHKSSVPGKLKSTVSYTATQRHYFLLVSLYPSKSASSCPHIQVLSLKFLECVRCCVHKWSQQDQHWQINCKYIPCYVCSFLNRKAMKLFLEVWRLKREIS